jgi:hypothetical protein
VIGEKIPSQPASTTLNHDVFVSYGRSLHLPVWMTL